MVPVPLKLDSGRVRIYFTTRDDEGRSRIGWGELAFPSGRVTYGDQPCLDLGSLGAFDDSGVMTGSLVRDGEILRLFYIGWSRGVTVPFYTFVGSAVSEDGGLSFTRVSTAPALERSATDPYLTTSPFAAFADGRWTMWYVSGTGWVPRRDGGPRHWYHIRRAESQDGLTWSRDGRPCIDYAAADEYAIARPCVVRDSHGYRMWYCHRGAAYRIGYAESDDGREWVRRDADVGIAPSTTGWDSEMIEYPYVFDHEGDRYMLYNGNGYGETGIGAAVLEEE
jgi:hypothetical protein